MAAENIWLKVSGQIASCIDRLGSGEFYPRFFQLMRTLAPIDQYMVFEFSPTGDYATCRLAHNVNSPDLGLELASLYLDNGYLDDPVLKELKDSVMSDPDSSPGRLLEKRTLPPIYRRRFFNVPSFDVKFAFVVLDRESQHLFYVNFYSKQEDGFSEAQQAQIEQASPLIGSLLLKHFRDERKQRGTVNSLLISGLSEREAQICNLILKGHTAKSISNELKLCESTVITYKKRAFGKLKINRKSELVRFV